MCSKLRGNSLLGFVSLAFGIVAPLLLWRSGGFSWSRSTYFTDQGNVSFVPPVLPLNEMFSLKFIFRVTSLSEEMTSNQASVQSYFHLGIFLFASERRQKASEDFFLCPLKPPFADVIIIGLTKIFDQQIAALTGWGTFDVSGEGLID